MTWKNAKEQIDYSAGGVISKVLFKTESGDATLFCMGANTTIGDHTSTKEGFVYVVEGNGTFILEGKHIDMLPGVLIFMEKNAVHSLKAEDNTSFILMLR